MAYGLPSRGQHDWDDEINNSVDAVKATADSASAAAAAAQSAANSAAASATTANNTANTANTNATNAVNTANSAATNAATALAATSDAGIANTVNAGTAVKAVIQALIDAKASAVEYHPKNYGAAENGVNDDTTALQNALNAADATDGVVKLHGGIYRITSPVTVPAGVSLQGAVSKLTGLSRSTIKLDSATACLKFQGGDARGGIHSGFNVNGNATGDPAGAVQITTVQQAFDNVTVTGAAGVGVLVFASQNTAFRGLDVNGSGTHNVVIDGGSGGLLFTRCEWTSPGGYSLKLTDGNPGGHPSYGYQYGPADIEFHKCILEVYAGTPAGLVRADAGNRVRFNNCGFSGNGVTSFSDGYVIYIDNPVFTNVSTIIAFDGCNFHGGATANTPIFYVNATRTAVNELIVNGHSFFQQSTAIFNTDGPSIGIVDDEGNYYASTITNKFGSLVGASWFFWRKVQKTGTIWALPDAAGAWAGHTPIAVRKDTDSTAGSRMYVANDGTLGWPNGTNNVAQVSLTPDTTNKFLTATGIKFSGKKLSGFSSVVVSGAQALTTDCSAIAPKYALILNSAGAVSSWTLSNPTDGQELQLWVTRAAAQTFVWPTNIQWNGNTAPSTAPTANQYTIVNLVYVAASNKWYEYAARTVGVPN